MLTLLEIRYRGYKALADYSIPLQDVNVITGVNNAGKSTALGALRLLDSSLRYAKHRAPEWLATSQGRRYGYRVPTVDLAVSLENVHTDLLDIESTVEFVLADGASLVLCFPVEGGLVFFVDGDAIPPRSPSAFRSRFPLEVVHVPVLGPLEHDEPLVREDTVRGGLSTHRASRHFRNYWHYYPDRFEEFASLVAKTWDGVVLQRPELSMSSTGPTLHLYCLEARATRELYWCGFGFQVWCQLLTHISRARPNAILVVDEPETYLHPIVQRRLLAVMKETGAQTIVATHAATLIASAEVGEVIGIERGSEKARRYLTRGTQLCVDLGLLPL